MVFKAAVGLAAVVASTPSTLVLPKGALPTQPLAREALGDLLPLGAGCKLLLFEGPDETSQHEAATALARRGNDGACTLWFDAAGRMPSDGTHPKLRLASALAAHFSQLETTGSVVCSTEATVVVEGAASLSAEALDLVLKPLQRAAEHGSPADPPLGGHALLTATLLGRDVLVPPSVTVALLFGDLATGRRSGGGLVNGNDGLGQPSLAAARAFGNEISLKFPPKFP